ncbi:MAG: zf-HC2 domain-containing protein [Aggregatilineales bacterium]
MRYHVTHLLPAYVHGQLNPKQLTRVTQHVRVCVDCRAALAREQAIARQLATHLPRIGQPAPGQLKRLWPRVRAEVFRAPRRAYQLNTRLWSSAGVLFVAVLIGAFALAALFGGPTSANAAPNQFVPGDVQMTNTPVHTDAPPVDATGVALLTPSASSTARVVGSPPPAPAPETVRWAH